MLSHPASPADVCQLTLPSVLGCFGDKKLIVSLGTPVSHCTFQSMCVCCRRHSVAMH